MSDSLSKDTIKNRYFKGKQLTSEDFKLEQQYLETLHRRILNHAIGKGILHGLQLQALSEKRFQVCAGSAIDEKGNIICVDKDVEVSLLEVEGFDSIQSQQVHVYLQERIEEWAPTFCAISDQEDHMEFNHIRQSWKLHVQDIHEHLHEEFFERTILYEDKDVCITQVLPALFPSNASFSMCIEVEKKQKLTTLSYSYHIKASDFEEEVIEVKGNANNTQQRVEKQYIPLQRKMNYGNSMCHITMSKEVLIQKNGKKLHVDASYEVNIPIYDDVQKELKRRCICEQTKAAYQGVYLGTIYMEEQKRSWKIESILCPDLQEYLQPLYAKRMEEYLLSSYQYTPTLAKTKNEGALETEHGHSGIICLHDMKKQQEVYLSEQIEHGYQASEVIIDISLQTQILQDGEKQTILLQGDMELFQSAKKKVSQMATQTLLQEGTFQIAVKTQYSPLTTFILWRAHKVQRESSVPHAMQFIRLEPSTITLKPLETCVFLPVFDAKEHICEITYTLQNKDSGTIGDDGTYCAPASCGVYQIQATSTHDESVYAYVNVRNPDV